MSKNNKLINQLKEIAKRNRDNIRYEQAMDLTPQVFASMAIALHDEFGFGEKRINRIIQRSQDIWADEKDHVIERCSDEVGINSYTRSDGL